MPGLVPGIHVLLTCGQDVDDRDKPGHDDWTWNVMRIPRRHFLHLAAGAIAAPTLPCIALAQAYPSRPVRIIVTFPPGGANDIHARLIGQVLSERMGQPFVIDNRPGASGNLGMEAAVRSPPDGYTLVFLSVTIAINASTYGKLSYDLVRDVAPVAGLYQSLYVMLVNPSLPVKTVPDFIAYAKQNPGKIAFGSNGAGATGHLAGEMLKMLTGVNMLHVPYRGEAPALTDLIAGHIPTTFVPMSEAYAQSSNPNVRILAVSSGARSKRIPDVPSIAETYPGYNAVSWTGMLAPAGTPKPIIDKLSGEMIRAVQDPKFIDNLTTNGVDAAAEGPEKFAEMIAKEIPIWVSLRPGPPCGVSFADENCAYGQP